MNAMDWLFGVMASMVLLFAIFGPIEGIHLPDLPTITKISGVQLPQSYVDLNVTAVWNTDTNTTDYIYSLLAHFDTNDPNRYLRITYTLTDGTDHVAAVYHTPSARDYQYSGTLADLPTYLQSGDVLVCAQAYNNIGDTIAIITQDCVGVGDGFGAGEAFGDGGAGAR